MVWETLAAIAMVVTAVIIVAGVTAWTVKTIFTRFGKSCLMAKKDLHQAIFRFHNLTHFYKTLRFQKYLNTAKRDVKLYS